MQDKAFGHTDRYATEARIGVAEMLEALPVTSPLVEPTTAAAVFLCLEALKAARSRS